MKIISVSGNVDVAADKTRLVMDHQIMMALNRYDNALRHAVRKDVIAEMAETWEASKLKACEIAWASCKAARIELEALIIERCCDGATGGRLK
jgi:hypothetical protein